MRSPNLSTATYTPARTPLNAEELPRFVEAELQRISATIALLAAGHIDTSTVAPAKPRAGDIRLADGTSWNPGSGAGIYAYYNNTWHFLG